MREKWNGWSEDRVSDIADMGSIWLHFASIKGKDPDIETIHFIKRLREIRGSLRVKDSQ
jgi:hypothetical protein